MERAFEACEQDFSCIVARRAFLLYRTGIRTLQDRRRTPDSRKAIIYHKNNNNMKTKCILEVSILSKSEPRTENSMYSFGNEVRDDRVTFS
jgi:hypothetical protein